MLANVVCEICPICGSEMTRGSPWCWACEQFLSTGARGGLFHHEFGDPTPVVANRWTGIAAFMGALSMVDVVMALASFLAGPFTCFITWYLTYYVLLIGLPIHAIAIVTGFRAKKPEIAIDFNMGIGAIGLTLSAATLIAVNCFLR